MIIGYLELELYAPWVHSLKEKRMEVQSLVNKLINKFRVSAVEAKDQDIHQRIVIDIAYLAANPALADSIADRLINYVETNTEAEIVKVIREQY
ncbi:MAG: DUF503 domain-containing protein [Lachnospiraceae bacterium]